MSKDLHLSSEQIETLLSPAAIRKSAQSIFQMTEQGKTHFIFHPEKLNSTVEYVLTVIKKNYPDLKIPFHSRWGHFRAGQVDRVQDLNQRLQNESPLERARIKLDLVVTSVLLDAGAGPNWKFQETSTGKSFSRSEGLGLASFYLFLSGLMSSDGKSLRADAQGLKKLNEDDLRKAFQVSDSNPLVGLKGRLSLMNNLAEALGNKKIFSGARPGNMIDFLIHNGETEVPAPKILRAVLEGLGPIWPGRLSSGGFNLGDVWHHSQSSQLVPFHKLSQWMTYSLIEPIEEAGIKVTGVEDLTGLAEYRNGGLLIDSGLLSFRNPQLAAEEWAPDSDLVIEWRALTIYLLDRIGEMVQKSLGKTPQDFPLAKVLEGGTWWAGRFLALQARPNGEPPIKIKSDGTVF